MSNSIENTEVQNKNLSQGLKELIKEANSLSQTAEQKIKEAYEYAINVDKLEPKEAAKVLKENLIYSPQWITKFLPQEAKQLQVKKVKVDSAFLQENEPKDVNFTTSTVIKEAEIIEEPKQFIPNNDLEQFRQEKALDTTTMIKEPMTYKEIVEDIEIRMSKKDVLKFIGELRLDVFKLPSSGSVIFSIKNNKLIYELV